MSDTDKIISRRKVLSTTGALGFGGVAGIQRGQAKNERNQWRGSESSSSDSGKVELKAENSGDKKEWEKIIKQRDINHPAVDEGVSVSNSSANLQNLTYVDHWEGTSNLSPGCWQGDDPNFEADHLCTVYKGVDGSGNIIKDSNGQYRYIVELWQQCRKTDWSGFLCRDGKIKMLKSRIYDEDGDITFHGRDPAGTQRVNSERIPVEHYAEVSGVAFGGEKVVEFNDGIFGATEWTPGPSGEYTCKWWGQEKRIEDMIAFVDIGSDYKLDFNWNPGIDWHWWVSTGI